MTGTARRAASSAGRLRSAATARAWRGAGRLASVAGPAEAFSFNSFRRPGRAATVAGWISWSNRIRITSLTITSAGVGDGAGVGMGLVNHSRVEVTRS